MNDKTFFERAAQVLGPNQFNDAQQAAIRAPDGPMLIEAGPGSGKTTVLVWRIVYMLAVLRVPAHDICVVTFTKAAADEMRARLGRLTNKARGMRMGTIHSMAKALLEEVGSAPKPLLRDHEQLHAVRQLLRSHNIPVTDDLPGSFINEVCAFRNRMHTPEQHIPHTIRTGRLSDPETFAVLARKYVDRLRGEGVSDFDGWIEQLHELLLNDGSVLEQRFTHVLVDEFQDTSLLQYEVLRKLVGPANGLYAVGDEDQSIYSWRGAGPEVFRRFTTDYPRAGRVLLDVNYRASRKLVETTNALISHNDGRGDKLIRAFAREDDGETEASTGREGAAATVDADVSPGLMRPGHDTDEASQIAGRLQQLHRDEEVPWREMAVLYRFNEQSLAFIARFGRLGIPFRILGEPPNPFRSWVGDDIVAYMRLAAGLRDGQLLEQIIYRPARYISKSATRQAMRPWQAGASLARSFAVAELNESQRTRIADLEQHLDRVSRLTPVEAVRFIRHHIGYDEYLLERSDGSPAEAAELLAKAVLTETVATGFDRLSEFVDFAVAARAETRGWWQRFVGRGNGFASGVNRERADDAVTLTTCHSAKGLEFDVVAVAGLVEGVLPAAGSESAEERRLAYVAMTRARQTLMLSVPFSLLGEDRTPSRFIKEATGVDLDIAVAEGEPKPIRRGPHRLKPDATVVGRQARPDAAAVAAFGAQLAPETKVRHKTFGDGRVRHVDDEKGYVTVAFVHYGEKQLLLEACVEKSLLKRLA